ncbi:MAG: helix-turn-helix domain-containing protein [Armatimonadetes bacterium]|nr:helix-turn-helix domain-containing protein [Armatimonadota bacterium]
MTKKQASTKNSTKSPIESGLAEEALSHPTRVRVLGWLRHQEAKTQSEVGKALALSNAAARYHLNVLEGSELVILQGTRSGPNGITEKLYAYNPEVWKQLSEQPDRAENFVFMLDYTFASIHEMHRKAVEMIKADWKPAFLAGSVGAFATPDEVGKLRGELNLLLDTFYESHKDASRPDTNPVAITFAVLPSRAEDAEGWAGERVFDWTGR